MTKQVQRRRGTSTQHTSFTGAEGEISVNTTNKSIHVHDGVTAGGVEAARADLTNVSDANLNAALSGNTLSSLTITSVDINGGTIDGAVIGGSSAAAGTFTTVTASGDLTIADKIVHSGDTNTSIRFPAADTVTVETSGAERLRVTSAGNVGIGTTSPDTIFEVVGADPILTIRDVDTSTTTANATIRFAESGAGDTLNEYWDVGLSPISALAFSRMGTERMRIDSSGNVGIGTSVPNSGANAGFVSIQTPQNFGLSVFRNSTDPAQVAFVDTTNSAAIGTNGAGSLVFFNAPRTTERMRIDSNGRVGIGTTSMTYPLDVRDAAGATINVQTASGNAAVRIASTASGIPRLDLVSSPGTQSIYGGVGSVNNMVFYVNATERMRIDSSGNVGIGTSSPRSKADVAGTLTVGDANPPTVNLYRNVALGSSSSAGLLAFGGRYDATNYATGAQISALTPSAWSSTNYGASLLFSTVASGSTTLTERMRIDSSGNVGIGTSSPTVALQIGGVAGGNRTFQMGSLGAIRFAITTDGVNGLTNIGCTNDSTTGALAFQTGAALTERMRITSAGNVGIGTSSPTGLLDASSGGYAIIMGADSGVTTRTDATPKLGRFGGYHYTNAEEPVCLILSSAEATNNVVSVGGGTGTMNTATQLRFFTAANSTTTTGTERMRIDSSGNVGIGTSAPSYRFHVVDTSLTSTTAGSNIIGRFQSNGSGADVNIQFSDGVSNASQVGMVGGGLYVRTQNTERMRITSTGNVGIGTTAPAARLDVTGASINALQARFGHLANRGLEISTALVSSRNDAGSVLNARADGQAGTLIFQREGTESMRITSTGNVGIGTSSPEYKLDVAGDVSIDNGGSIVGKNTTGGDAQLLYWSATSGVSIYGRNTLGGSVTQHEFRTAGTTRLTIDNSGNVGIGETAPDYKLDVNGAIGFTPGSSVTPVDNGDVVFELTNNTTLTIKAKGSDGVVRSATITLA